MRSSGHTVCRRYFRDFRRLAAAMLLVLQDAAIRSANISYRCSCEDEQRTGTGRKTGHRGERRIRWILIALDFWINKYREQVHGYRQCCDSSHTLRRLDHAFTERPRTCCGQRCLFLLYGHSNHCIDSAASFETTDFCKSRQLPDQSPECTWRHLLQSNSRRGRWI